uniref:Flavin-containing monooxygenase n=1 Tax=Culicoides sonorensis TaxID=179676 RepID=A0A336KXK0_CULSO
MRSCLILFQKLSQCNITNRIMTKVAVIGAGIAGLAACKYSKQAKLEVDVFEQTNNIGGTWVYTDKIGTDKYGLQIHSSMYRNLHTNLPKETMGYHDYKYSGFERSYITPSEVMEFLENYVEHFGLRDHIKFEHLVTKVEPLPGDKWSVTVLDLKKDESFTRIYDAIFICNGHYSTPNVPKLQGSEYFKGKVMHSHDYRYPEPFKDQKVLIIGAGPSGVDITRDVSTTAEFVGFSHHLPSKILNAYDENVTQLPDVAQILDDGKVHFYDGQVLEFDTIIFCTGYKYVYPFLSPECQIKVEDNHVTELYKHIININYPTMYFIGIPFTTIIVPLADIQIH